MHGSVEVVRENGSLMFKPVEGAENAQAMTGTSRALVNNMLIGVSQGFERRLQLSG